MPAGFMTFTGNMRKPVRKDLYFFLFRTILNTVYKITKKYNLKRLRKCEVFMPMIRHLGLKAYGKINLGSTFLGRERMDTMKSA